MTFMDNETGEIIATTHKSECNFDVETGECVSDAQTSTGVIRKTKFNVPRSYLVQSEPKKAKEKCCLDSQETYSLTSKAKVIELKEVRMHLTLNPYIVNFATFRKSSSATTKPATGCSSSRRSSSSHASPPSS